MAKKYNAENIMIFPSSNASDGGKVNSEKNITSIITRITDKNFIISGFGITRLNSIITLAPGYANVTGYLIVTDSALNYDLSGVNNTANTNYNLIMQTILGGSPSLILADNGGVCDGLILDLKTNVELESMTTNSYLKLATISSGSTNNTWDLNSFELDATRFATIESNKILHDEELLYDLINDYARKSGTTFTGEVTIGTGSTTTILDVLGNVKVEYQDAETNNTILKAGNDNDLTGLEIEKDNFSSYHGNTNDNSYLRNIYDDETVSEIEFSKTGKINFSNINDFEVNTTNGNPINLTSNNNYKISIGHAVDGNIKIIKHSSGSDETLFEFEKNSSDSLLKMQNLSIKGSDTGGTLSANTLTLIGSVGGVVIPNLKISDDIIIGTAQTGLKLSSTTLQLLQNSNIIAAITNNGFISGIDGNSTNYIKTTPTSIDLNAISGTANKINFRYAGTIKNSLYNNADTDNLILTGNLNVQGNITATKVQNAYFNDYAEFYEKDNLDEIVEPGDVVEINPKTGKYKKSTLEGSTYVVGVCSDSYGHIVGGDQLDNIEDNNDKYIPIAISGRVFVKIKGEIKIGDLLTSINGQAIKFEKEVHNLGSIIGKALSTPLNDKILMQVILG